MDFLEQFRRGPETQSEWNLLLWRITFPMIALVLFTLLAVLGKFGHRVYSFLVCPVWYFSQFVLVAHPFLLVFKFDQRGNDANFRRRMWRMLAVLSIAISVMEWFLSSPPDAAGRPRGVRLPASHRARFLRHSWIVANTVFGVIALVAIPRYFFTQRRVVARDSYETLALSPNATTLFVPALSPVTIPPSTTRADLFRDDHALLSPRASASALNSNSPLTISTATTPPTSSRGGSSARAYPPVMISASASSASISVQADLKRRSRAVFLLTAGCAVLVWIAMFSSYKSLKTAELISKYWFTIYLFSPVVCALLIYVLRGPLLSSSVANASSSFDFVAIYSVLIVHLPVFLGHLCFRLFTIIELADPAHPAHAETRGIDFATGTGSGSDVSFSASTSWLKLGISVVYLLVMQTYFYAMTHVVNAMAEPFAHPSLLYLGQLYYYLFWYVLVGSDTPIDALYWGMLLVNNIHIAFLNTGIYADVKQTSSSCFSTPLFATNLSMFKGSSMAMCFRATTITMANVTAASVAACRSHAASSTKGDKMTRTKMEAQQTGLQTPGHVDLFVSSSDLEDADSSESGTTVLRATRRHQSMAKSSTDSGDTIDLALAEDSTEQGVQKKAGIRRTSWTSLLSLPTRSFLAFGGVPTAGATTTSTGPVPSSSATIYFRACTCSHSRSDLSDALSSCACSHLSTSDHASSCVDATSSSSSRTGPASTIASPPVHRGTAATNVEQLRPLYFLMKLAEQDNMADTTALILVPSLLTLLAVLEKPTHGFAIITDQLNLWVRCILMFLGRMGGAYLAREIFTYKLRSRLRQNPSSRRHHPRSTEDAMLSDVDGISTRLWIQRLMLQDFHRHFWYLTVVTIVVTFACFERMEVPARFALLT